MTPSRAYILMLLLAAAACTKVPEVGGVGAPVPSDEPIGFAVSGEGTKGQAPITTLAALARQDFSVSAWYSPAGKKFADLQGIGYFSNHRFGYVTNDLAGETTFPNAWRGVAAHGTTGAVSANPVYWPLDGSLSFFCYAPYQDGSTDIVLEPAVTDAGIAARLPDYLPGSPLIRVTPAASAADQEDFLCAPPALDRTSAGGSLPLDFSRHRMTRVEFWFAYKGTLQSDPSITETYEQVRVSSIRIENVVSSRYFYFQEAAPSAVGCGWSYAVSPANPALDGAAFPKTAYRLESTTSGELKTGVDASLEDIEHGGAYRFINDTPAGHLYLLPQTLPADARLVITYTILNLYAGTRVSEVVTWNLDAGAVTAWPEGKVVRYLITLDLPDRGAVNVKTFVFPWEDSGNVHNEQELLY